MNKEMMEKDLDIILNTHYRRGVFDGANLVVLSLVETGKLEKELAEKVIEIVKQHFEINL